MDDEVEEEVDEEEEKEEVDDEGEKGTDAYKERRYVSPKKTDKFKCL